MVQESLHLQSGWQVLKKREVDGENYGACPR
jgi:hypothetical protein